MRYSSVFVMTGNLRVMGYFISRVCVKFEGFSWYISSRALEITTHINFTLAFVNFYKVVIQDLDTVPCVRE